MRRKPVWAAAAALCLAALAIGAALSWHKSSLVLVPSHSPWSEDVEIVRVEPGRLVLERSKAALRPGRYGLRWHGGHAVAGPIVRSHGRTVTRRLSELQGQLVPGVDAGFDSDVYAGDPRQALGLPYRQVPVRGELGPSPAWRVPGHGPGLRAGTWAIFVHGHNGDRQNGLRILPTLRKAGLTSLLIAYRNDPGAPPSPDGLHHLGMTEWRDLQAAARYAGANGARRLVLVGASMGGAIVGQFMQRSPLAPRVAAIVLDAPVLDWRSVLSFNAREQGFPSAASLPLRWAIQARIDVDWDSLDLTEKPGRLEAPVLLFHGEDDGVVPIEDSDEFAADPRNRVTYHTVAGAGHVRSWNVAPRRYERRLLRFLAKTLQTAPKQQRARPLGSGSR